MVALSSLNEGTPLTVLEGLSFAKPVLTTEVGGVVDILGQRGQRREGFQLWEHGVSVASGDAEAFAAALCWIAQAPAAERAAMGEHGRDIVLSRYSKQRLVADTERLYLELLGPR